MRKKLNVICPYCGEEDVEVINGRYHCRYCDNYFEPGDEPNDGDIPAGCAACGGPYPSCKTSCNLFDD